MSYNAGLLFYKHYYDGIQFDGGDKIAKNRFADNNLKVFKARNKTLTELKFDKTILPVLTTAEGFHSFSLTVANPGLIIGTGYAHGSGLEGEFKTGFFFDHTTGMPVIPGSSIKGLIRNAFPVMYYEKAEAFAKKGKEEESRFWKKLGDNRKKFISALLHHLQYTKDFGDHTIEKLEREIFEGLTGTNREKADHHFAMVARDQFMDAIITGADKQGLIFDDEFITPHKNPLKNPIPIQILKVRPGVTFTFQFRLPELTSVPRILTPAQRIELFRQILMFMGAGAKTNTGFGHFEPDKMINLSGGVEKAPEQESHSSQPQKAKQQALPSDLEDYTGRIKVNEILSGKVVAQGKPFGQVEIKVKGEVYQVAANGNLPEPGRMVRLKINAINNKTGQISQVGLIGLI